MDTFHVIQASTKTLEEVRKQAQSKLSRQEALALKQDKEIFAKPLEDLTEEEQERFKRWQQIIPELCSF